MGNNASVSNLSVPLEPLPHKAVAISAIHCSSTTRRLLVQAKVSFSVANVTYSIHNYDNGVQGDLVYWLDGHQVLTDGNHRPIARVLASENVRGIHVVDFKSTIALFSLRHILRPRLPATIGTFRDRLTRKEWTIGYTGDWTRSHDAVVWLTHEDDPETRVTVARVYPVRGKRFQSQYCVEVAAGMDCSILVLLCFVLDNVGEALLACKA